MKILLTGAAGQLGKCFTDCIGKDIEVFAADRESLDITDVNAIQNVFSDFVPDVIVNAAAYTAVDKAESDIDAARAINCTGVKYLTNAAIKYNIPLVHISTDYVFNGHNQLPYNESDTCDPKSVYGMTKLEGEIEALKSPLAIVIRTSWVFSEYGNNFVKTMLRLGRDRDALSIVGDQFGCPTYAGDIAEAILSILSNDNVKPGVYHYSGNHMVTWYQFAEEVFKIASKSNDYKHTPELVSISTENYPTPAVRPKFSVLNTDKLHNLGIAPSNWKERLATIVPKIINDQ